MVGKGEILILHKNIDTAHLALLIIWAGHDYNR